MVLLNKRKKYLKKVDDFLNNLKRPEFEKDYLLLKSDYISCLEWLKAYYENRAGCTPKYLLRTLLNKDGAGNSETWIRVLYFWVKEKRIYGF